LSEFGTADELRSALPSPDDLVQPEDKVGMSRVWVPEHPELDEATIVQTSINEINRLWPVFNTVALRHPP
jgi:alkanesulfonate monooxygenase SsuD/methylene tetrahydromethanopterin reductase-like flavin-dependent oxidoreductase (luciferase family)